MTNKYLAIVALLNLGPGEALVVVQHSPPAIVHQGEVASLFCQSDLEFDSCTWLLPNQRTCGPLSATQRMCRSAGQEGSNIHFTGSSTNCSIKINGVQSAQSGLWACSLEKDGDLVVADNIQLVAAHQANLDFDGEVFGGYLISNTGEKLTGEMASLLLQYSLFKTVGSKPSLAEQITADPWDLLIGTSDRITAGNR